MCTVYLYNIIFNVIYIINLKKKVIKVQNTKQLKKERNKKIKKNS
jgi:hypothetical protein